MLVEATNGDEELLGWVGAGPLEDVIRNGGDDAAVIAAEVERAARQEPLFRKALSGVWLNADVPEGVRARLAVFGARDFVAEHGMTELEAAAYVADRKAKGWLGMGY